MRYSIEKNVGKNIKRIRKEQGMTQEELGEKIGAIKQTISKIERGVFSPSFAVLLKICEALSTTPNELLLTDVQWLEWRTENSNHLEYSIKGLQDKVEIVESLWAEADWYRLQRNEEMERRTLDQIIGIYAWTNEHYREIAEYLYRKDLNTYLDKTSKELRGNMLMNLQILKKKEQEEE